jgi:hypothetical protein
VQHAKDNFRTNFYDKIQKRQQVRTDVAASMHAPSHTRGGGLRSKSSTGAGACRSHRNQPQLWMHRRFCAVKQHKHEGIRRVVVQFVVRASTHSALRTAAACRMPRRSTADDNGVGRHAAYVMCSRSNAPTNCSVAASAQSFTCALRWLGSCLYTNRRSVRHQTATNPTHVRTWRACGSLFREAIPTGSRARPGSTAEQTDVVQTQGAGRGASTTAYPLWLAGAQAAQLQAVEAPRKSQFSALWQLRGRDRLQGLNTHRAAHRRILICSPRRHRGTQSSTIVRTDGGRGRRSLHMQ